MFLQPKFEAVLSEIDMVANDLRYTICNLESWVQPSYVGKNLVSNVHGVTDFASDKTIAASTYCETIPHDQIGQIPSTVILH